MTSMLPKHTEWGAASTETYSVAKSRNYKTDRSAAAEFVNTGNNWRTYYLAKRQVFADGTPASEWVGHDDE